MSDRLYYDDPKYAVLPESMPISMRYMSNAAGNALADADALAAFLQGVMAMNSDSPMDDLELDGMRLCFALLRDKIHLAAGDLELPPIAFRSDKTAPKLWTPDKGVQDE